MCLALNKQFTIMVNAHYYTNDVCCKQTGTIMLGHFPMGKEAAVFISL